VTHNFVGVEKSEDDWAHILEITFEAKYIYSRKFLSGEKNAVTTYFEGYRVAISEILLLLTYFNV